METTQHDTEHVEQMETRPLTESRPAFDDQKQVMDEQKPNIVKAASPRNRTVRGRTTHMTDRVPYYLTVTGGTVCWRCGETGHTRFRCQRPHRLFCSRCGRVGILSKECPCRTDRTRKTADAKTDKRRPTMVDASTQCDLRRATETRHQCCLHRPKMVDVSTQCDQERATETHHQCCLNQPCHYQTVHAPTTPFAYPPRHPDTLQRWQHLHLGRGRNLQPRH